MWGRYGPPHRSSAGSRRHRQTACRVRPFRTATGSALGQPAAL